MTKWKVSFSLLSRWWWCAIALEHKQVLFFITIGWKHKEPLLNSANSISRSKRKKHVPTSAPYSFSINNIPPGGWTASGPTEDRIITQLRPSETKRKFRYEQQQLNKLLYKSFDRRIHFCARTKTDHFHPYRLPGFKSTYLTVFFASDQCQNPET